MKILIVDDEINIANGIKNILNLQSNHNYQIEVAYNGEDALKIGKYFKPALLITDIVMPDMLGLDLIKLFQEKEYCRYVIVLSGHDKFSYAQIALRYGVIDYLLKPVDSDRLLEQCQKIYDLLPETYANSNLCCLPDIPYFSLNLHNPDYPETLKKIISFVEKNYMREISLQVIADELFLHPNYMSSLINKHCGFNFTYLLDFVRLSAAVNLFLSDDHLTISEISYLVGYNNERRLYSAFQNRLNSTPRLFKANHKPSGLSNSLPQ